MKSLKKQKGAITFLTALLLPVLLACTGMAVDIGRLYMEKSRLQNIADAAVLAGLAELKENPETKNLIKIDSCQMVNNMPIGALTYNSSVDQNSSDDKPFLSVANNAADISLKNNSGNLFKINTTRNQSGEEVITALYRIRNNENSILSEENKYTFYYEVIVRNDYPLFFSKIIYPHDTMRVRAGALAKFDEAVTVLVLSLDGTYMDAFNKLKNKGKEKYAAYDSTNEMRLAADQQALDNIATYFIGKTTSQLSALGINTNSKNFFGTTNGKNTGTRNEEQCGASNFNTLLLSLRDKDETGNNLEYINNEIRLATGWLQGDNDAVLNKSEWTSNTRFLYSDDIINNNAIVNGATIKTQIRAQFHLDSENKVDSVHVFVVRDDNVDRNISKLIFNGLDRTASIVNGEIVAGAADYSSSIYQQNS